MEAPLPCLEASPEREHHGDVRLQYAWKPAVGRELQVPQVNLEGGGAAKVVGRRRQLDEGL